ncbi:unnamed protein product, partial [Protopolystoma xenopodis]
GIYSGKSSCYNHNCLAYTRIWPASLSATQFEGRYVYRISSAERTVSQARHRQSLRRFTPLESGSCRRDVALGREFTGPTGPSAPGLSPAPGQTQPRTIRQSGWHDDRGCRGEVFAMGRRSALKRVCTRRRCLFFSA